MTVESEDVNTEDLTIEDAQEAIYPEDSRDDESKEDDLVDDESRDDGSKEDESKENESKEDDSKDDDTKDDDSKEDETVPESYDLKASDEKLVDKDDIDKIAEYSKEQGLSQKEAEERLHIYEQGAKSHDDKMQAQLNKEHDRWVKMFAEDEEIGGDNMKEAAELSKRVVEKFGEPVLADVLKETKMGNFPELIRMLYRVGKAMDSDKFIPGGNNNNAVKDIEDVFYGKDKK